DETVAETGDVPVGTTETPDDAPAAEMDITPAAPADGEPDAFRGERPALRLVENPARRQSDKVVQLETRRNRGGLFDGLSTGEQAAFREIARQLGESFGKRKADDRPVGDPLDEPAVVPDAQADIAQAIDEAPAA